MANRVVTTTGKPSGPRKACFDLESTELLTLVAFETTSRSTALALGLDSHAVRTSALVVVRVTSVARLPGFWRDCVIRLHFHFSPPFNFVVDPFRDFSSRFRRKESNVFGPFRSNQSL
jgi:hypothetical protein